MRYYKLNCVSRIRVKITGFSRHLPQNAFSRKGDNRVYDSTETVAMWIGFDFRAIDCGQLFRKPLAPRCRCGGCTRTPVDSQTALRKHEAPCPRFCFSRYFIGVRDDLISEEEEVHETVQEFVQTAPFGAKTNSLDEESQTVRVS